jgi:hypothetical protein
MLHFHDGVEHITSPVDDEMILFSDDSKSVVEDWIKAYRLVNPDVVIYLCDHNNQVYQHFYDNPARDTRRKREDLIYFFKGLAIVLALNIIVTAIFGYARLSGKPIWLLALVAGPCLFYIGTVKTGVTNVIEGIVVSTTLTIVIWCILPTLLRYLKI